jgi:lysyl endopeptidase
MTALPLGVEPTVGDSNEKNPSSAKDRRGHGQEVAECALARTGGAHLRAVALVFSLALIPHCQAKERELPVSFSMFKDQEQVDLKTLPSIDVAKLLAEDQAQTDWREPKPLRFALPAKVQFTLDNSGTWNAVREGSRIWRLRIRVPNATNLSLGITTFELPEGGKLWIYNSSHDSVQGPYTAQDRSQAGRLWTPMVAGSELDVEVFLPAPGVKANIEITAVNCGYRELFKKNLKNGKTDCNKGVSCPEVSAWKDEVRSVAMYSVDGYYACTGQLLNNTAGDLKPYFLSANHCEVGVSNADTVVVYWNFVSSTCGSHASDPPSQNQTGAIFRAARVDTDFLLLELRSKPDPSYHVFYAGWDARRQVPRGTICIHHPNSSVKVVALSRMKPFITSYGGASSNVSGGYWSVHWDLGATDAGSSGACAWDADSGRCIGQLRGGRSSCPGLGDNGNDFFGGLGFSWEGETPSQRLKDWLDPVKKGMLALDGTD